MICDFCRRAADNNIDHLHADCPSGTHCDCQHRRTVKNEQKTAESLRTSSQNSRHSN